MFVCFKNYYDNKCHTHQDSRYNTCHKHICDRHTCDGCIYNEGNTWRYDDRHRTCRRHQRCGKRCGETALLYHCRDQNSAKGCYCSRTGTGDCSEETGNNNAYNRDTTFFVSDAGVDKIDQSAGNSGFCHNISGQYKERNCKKKEFTDS